MEELDLGEAESIALAIEHKAQYLIIDEYRGRLIAEQYGVKIVGVLGILIQAKQDGLIDSVKDEVQSLRQVGFRLNQRLEPVGRFCELIFNDLLVLTKELKLSLAG